MNPMDIKRGMDQATKLVLEDLSNQATMIESPESIKSVATIASNGDETIGELITNAFEKVGKDGTITVSDGKTLDHELEVVQGLKFDNPFILLFDKKISSIQTILPLLEQIVKLQRP